MYKYSSSDTMNNPLPPAVQCYLNSASFEDFDKFQGRIALRMQELEKPQADIERLCFQHGWVYRWYPHPAIPRTIFLRIWFNGNYQEFVGYHRNKNTAYNFAAQRALAFFRNH